MKKDMKRNFESARLVLFWLFLSVVPQAVSWPAPGLASLAASHNPGCLRLLQPPECSKSPFQTAEECDFAKRYSIFTPFMTTEDWRAYSSHVIREWLRPFDQMKPSPILGEQVPGSKDEERWADEYWEIRKSQVEFELQESLEVPPFTNDQLLEVAWMVANMYAISELPSDPLLLPELKARWASTKSLITKPIGEVLQDPEEIPNSFWRNSRLARVLSLRGFDRGHLIFLPLAESVSFLSMNQLMLQGVLPLELKPQNIADFDRVPALQLGGFAHDEIHTVQILKMFGVEGLHWLRTLYHRFVKPEVEPFQRRIKEYVFWFLWHEDQVPYLLMRQVQEGKGLNAAQVRALHMFQESLRQQFENHARESFRGLFPERQMYHNQLIDSAQEMLRVMNLWNDQMPSLKDSRIPQFANP